MTTIFVPFNASGRDIVVGDVHGCFRTLERALGQISFDPLKDRLFGVGDLVNRGPHSQDALEWLEQRFDAVVLGNHDWWVLNWFSALVRFRPEPGAEWVTAVRRRDYRRWRRALERMPLAVTIETRHGRVGIVHAEAPYRSWSKSLDALDVVVATAVDDALLGSDAPREVVERRRGCGVEGLRALVHGHQPVEEVE